MSILGLFRSVKKGTILMIGRRSSFTFAMIDTPKRAHTDRSVVVGHLPQLQQCQSQFDPTPTITTHTFANRFRVSQHSKQLLKKKKKEVWQCTYLRMVRYYELTRNGMKLLCTQRLELDNVWTVRL